MWHSMIHVLLFSKFICHEIEITTINNCESNSMDSAVATWTVIDEVGPAQGEGDFVSK